MTGTGKDALILAESATALARSWEDAATAALALADEWERRAASVIYLSGHSQPFDRPAVSEFNGRSSERSDVLRRCARELRSAIGGAVTGESGTTKTEGS